jgi:hypothetical protein
MEEDRVKISRVAGRRWRPIVFATAAAFAAAVTFSRAPFGQDPAYHVFADRRMLLGIPNALDVLSNLAFLVVGVAGVWFLVRRPGALADRRERAAWLVFFGAVALIAIGSGYYHLDPSNGTLLWDRLPMSIAFMGLFSALVGERSSALTGRRMLLPAIAAGMGSVLYWYFTEMAGQGDLRPYVFVQFFPMLAVPLLLVLFPARYTDGAHWVVALALYALAKMAEVSDVAVFRAGSIVSGHTLKHLLAALAIAVFLRMLSRRSSTAPVDGREPDGTSADAAAPGPGARGRRPARIST